MSCLPRSKSARNRQTASLSPLGALIVVGLLTATASCRTQSTETGSHPTPKSVDVSAATLNSLAVLATGTSGQPGWSAATAEAISKGTTSVDEQIARLLAQPGFAEDVGPGIALHNWALFDVLNIENQTFIGYVLEQSEPDAKGQRVHFLRESCRAGDAELVEPWWAPGKPILVCPDSHRPKAFADPSNGWHCDGRSMANALSEETFCGCGPRLLRCYPDRASLRAYANGLVGEVVATAAHVISSDLPVSTMYTMNESVRGRYAELAYRRWRVEAGEPETVLDGISEWPLNGVLAPRHRAHAGQHAGVLSTELVAFVETGMRPTLKNMFEKLWCSDASGAHVGTEAMLELATAVGDVRAGAGWEELATKPICESCHARLDYGMQFFSGFPDVRTAGHYQPDKRRVASGPLYLRDSRDLRGTAALTPQSFATLSTAQPEFASCVVKRVADHVFADRQSPLELAILERAFAAKPTLRHLMEAALNLYVARQGRPTPHAVGPSFDQRFDQSSDPSRHGSVVGVGEPSELDNLRTVSLDKTLAAKLDSHCSACHSGDSQVSVSSERLPRDLVTRMLSNVSSGRMPLGTMLPRSERRQLTAELVAVLWEQPGQRQAAFRFFGGELRALPVHHVPRALERLRSRLGSTSAPTPWPLIEKWITGDLVQLTPGLMMVVGLETLRVCRERGLTGADLDACLERGTDPFELINDVNHRQREHDYRDGGASGYRSVEHPSEKQ